MSLDPVTIATFLVTVSILGISKGGLAGVGMMAMPTLLFVMPPAQAAGLMLPILMIQDAFSVWLYRAHWDRGNVKLLLPAALIGIGLGFTLFWALPERPILGILGIVTLAFALRGILNANAPSKVPSKRVGFLLGMMSGFTSTVFHQGGPPFQIYLIPQRLPRDVFVGTGVMFFAAVNLIKLPGFIVLGQITREGLIIAAISAPFALFMTYVGMLLVRRFSAERFYQIIYWLLALVGTKLLFDAIIGR
ncbi:sulfite exporter TauE/SafE family protein [Acuticoccus sp. M5D2P5]|uniref:sulfite exporter TauE/SafE family protein n=1 Tax=Acuticoccus kalidii TaxID=2910977 RepID=UPI001F35FB57|nr:sulfite exporter TauE/SafE family protein [Acuticoccus kalidii]MCF3931952.1 sulfite exporter TauE/SafE family protein [Acuticoccus kalidii]